MDLKQWDREAAAIFRGLAQAERVLATTVDGPVRAIARLKAMIHRIQGTLTQDLEKIIYLASPKGSFRPQDKSLLYWATQYSSHAQKLIREVEKRTSFTMWLKLVQHRVVGHASSVSWSLLKFGENALFLRAQRKKNLSTELELGERLKAIACEKAELTARYNTLVLTRANRDAAGCLQMNFGNDPAEALAHPLLEAFERLLLNGSLKIRNSNRPRLARSIRRMDLLTQFVSTDSDRSRAKPSNASQADENHLESFDKLSDRLMGINPLRDAALCKLDQIQTKRANREASEITLTLPERPPLRGGHRVRMREIGRLTTLKPGN